MKRYFMEIAYDGSFYAGSQIQHNNITVQEIIDQKLSILLKEKVETLFSSRTDAGVHCRQQFLHVDTDKSIDDFAKFCYSLNCLLPSDIVIKQVFEVKNEVHARFSAIRRVYQYHISPTKNPFTLRSSWQFFPKLSLEKMNKACKHLIGEQDFQSFCKVHTQTPHFLCNVSEAFWEEKNGEIVFTIISNRFLRGMVRLIVGTLVDVGRGKITDEHFQHILASKDVRKASGAAPAHGLFLCRVDYPDDIQLLY